MPCPGAGMGIRGAQTLRQSTAERHDPPPSAVENAQRTAGYGNSASTVLGSSTA